MHSTYVYINQYICIYCLPVIYIHGFCYGFCLPAPHTQQSLLKNMCWQIVFPHRSFCAARNFVLNARVYLCKVRSVAVRL